MSGRGTAGCKPRSPISARERPARTKQVRIVAGQWRGRSLVAPAGNEVRPTADRVREAWLNIVQPDLVDARVIDLFAGSGALGLEALSRGALHVDFVEKGAAGLRALARNIEALGAGDRARVHRADAIRYMMRLEAGAYDLAFADPPYGGNLATRVAEQWLETPFADVLGIEHGKTEELPAGGAVRRYGSTALTFYRRPEVA
jgi:16S rRNA (guanine966-N2)-methyltransferase